MFVCMYPLKCKTGVVADAMTGYKMVWNQEKEKYVIDPVHHKVNKKVNKRVYADTYCVKFVQDKASLYYVLTQGDRVNKRGLNLEKIYEVTVFPDGSFAEAGDRTVWEQHRNRSDICHNLVQLEFFDEYPSVKFYHACMRVFGDAPCNIQCNDILELVEKTLNGHLTQFLLDKRVFDDKFGFELEFTGISRWKAAQVLSELFGFSEIDASHPAKFFIKDRMGRDWVIAYDASIRASCGKNPTEDREYQCELVSPLCSYQIDMKATIQPIIRALRACGAIVNSSCGFHVHVSEANYTAENLRQLLILFAKNEDMLFEALDVNENRQTRYCSKTSKAVLRRMDIIKVRNMEDLSLCWYASVHPRTSHYDLSRYVALNYHSLFTGKGVEYRLFNSTLHAGKIRSYVLLALALTRFAKNDRCFDILEEVQSGNDLHNMESLLDVIGLAECPEFRSVRKHLLRVFRDQNARFNAA